MAETLDIIPLWYGMVWYGMVWYGMVWCGGAEQIPAFDCFYICVGKIDLHQTSSYTIKRK